MTRPQEHEGQRGWNIDIQKLSRRKCNVLRGQDSCSCCEPAWLLIVLVPDGSVCKTLSQASSKRTVRRGSTKYMASMRTDRKLQRPMFHGQRRQSGLRGPHTPRLGTMVVRERAQQAYSLSHVSVMKLSRGKTMLKRRIVPASWRRWLPSSISPTRSLLNSRGEPPAVHSRCWRVVVRQPCESRDTNAGLASRRIRLD